MRGLLKAELEKIRQEQSLPDNRIAQYRYLLTRLMQLGWYFIRARFSLRCANKLGRLVFVRGGLDAQNKGFLVVGNRTRIWSTIHPTQLYVGKGARMAIGEGCYINGALLSASQEVSIGKNCFLGPMAHVLDSPYFGLGEEASARAAQSIIIEDDVWLATRCTVVGGVRIGRGAVVAVGAMVVDDVPSYSIVAGVPARVVRHIHPSEQPTPILFDSESAKKALGGLQGLPPE